MTTVVSTIALLAIIAIMTMTIITTMNRYARNIRPRKLRHPESPCLAILAGTTTSRPFQQPNAITRWCYTECNLVHEPIYQCPNSTTNHRKSKVHGCGSTLCLLHVQGMNRKAAFTEIFIYTRSYYLLFYGTCCLSVTNERN